MKKVVLIPLYTNTDGEEILGVTQAKEYSNVERAIEVAHKMKTSSKQVVFFLDPVAEIVTEKTTTILGIHRAVGAEDYEHASV
jgi:hypothetical protein